jgi:hypothetical protein
MTPSDLIEFFEKMIPLRIPRQDWVLIMKGSLMLLLSIPAHAFLFNSEE